MSIGVSHKITRTRLSTDLRRIVTDASVNFLRVPDPFVAGQFYDFATELLTYEHIVKIYDNSGVFVGSYVLSSVAAHHLTVATAVSPQAPHYGIDDVFEVYKRDGGGVLQLVCRDLVRNYAPLEDNTYNVAIEILGASNISKYLFVHRRENILSMDENLVVSVVNGAPLFDRVVNDADMAEVKDEPSFVFDVTKAGAQYLRKNVVSKAFATEEEAEYFEASVLGQILQALARISAGSRLRPTFSVLPGSGTIQIGQLVYLNPVGSGGLTEWSIIQNESGSSITRNGEYRAGSTTGVDVVKAINAYGAEVLVTFYVENDYSSTFEGSITWDE